MADINHIISLGVGTPGAIPEFLTFGLQIGDAVVYVPSIGRTFFAGSEERGFTVSSESRTFYVGEEL